MKNNKKVILDSSEREKKLNNPIFKGMNQNSIYFNKDNKETKDYHQIHQENLKNGKKS